jgi:SRSO17 transposase
VRFATKPALGLGMLQRALNAGVPASWVTADEAYGQDSKFRLWLQQPASATSSRPRSQKIPTNGRQRPRRRPRQRRARAGLEASQLRPGRQRPTHLRLGPRLAAGCRHPTVRLHPLAADPPLYHPPRGDGLLPMPRAHRYQR